MHVTSRIRRDAAVYELTPPRTGKRGRPRKKGARLPALAALAAAATDWARVDYDQRARLVWPILSNLGRIKDPLPGGAAS
ncbi:MAG TPA: hypothetical protein VM324_01870 [Egibacteraceae bacterium]|nr:hypothetical protein [Egibacteraceae bacterium]